MRFLKRMIVSQSIHAGCIAWAAGAALSAGAATLTTVPMQGSMVMPMVAYHASDGSLTVQVDPTIPQLTPLLVSNPGDSFDTADPWFGYLDPSHQGLAFSRRYGFSMDTMSDPLPAGTAIWIRKLSSSDGLGAYRYRSSSPKLWEPIFGTGGVTNALYWDGTMFHPGFTAPPGTGAYTATFEAFLLNTADGTLVPGANSGPFTLNWTVVPDGRPTLSITQRIVIGWPLSATNYVLEAADKLPASSWTTMTNSPVLLDGQMAVVLETSAATRFFRMRLAP
jgi:hypothetical protein